MRLKLVAAVFAAFTALGLVASQPAHATCHYDCAPAGWGQVRTVKHYGYYPRYRHVYKVHYATDPYAYRYEPRGYYPYYNSGYWRSAHEMRARRAYRYTAVPTPYYAAWGAPVRGYHHRAWHARHHGRIRVGHW